MIRAILSVSLSRYCRLGFGRAAAPTVLILVAAVACSVWDLPSDCCLPAWGRIAGGCACHCDRPCAWARASDCPAGNCSLACAARPAAEASHGRGAAQASLWVADDSRCAEDRSAGPAQQVRPSEVRHSCRSTAANENSKAAPVGSDTHRSCSTTGTRTGACTTGVCPSAAGEDTQSTQQAAVCAAQ